MDSGQRDETRDSERKLTAAARIVQTNDRKLPYKVVFTDENDLTTERAFASMQDCEAFIRRRTPVPPERSRLYDRKAGEA